MNKNALIASLVHSAVWLLINWDLTPLSRIIWYMCTKIRT